jgi:hypothetical protein
VLVGRDGGDDGERDERGRAVAARVDRDGLSGRQAQCGAHGGVVERRRRNEEWNLRDVGDSDEHAGIDTGVDEAIDHRVVVRDERARRRDCQAARHSLNRRAEDVVVADPHRNERGQVLERLVDLILAIENQPGQVIAVGRRVDGIERVSTWNGDVVEKAVPRSAAHCADPRRTPGES